MDKFKDCISLLGDDYCFFHECGPTDPEQCGKENCPHCTVKTIKNNKLQFTNSYLKDKDFDVEKCASENPPCLKCDYCRNTPINQIRKDQGLEPIVDNPDAEKTLNQLDNLE